MRPQHALEKVIFLDRDGTINRDSPYYIKSWDEFEFLPGSLEALTGLTRGGFSLIVITNQSAVGRGMISLEILEHMHRMMRREIAAAGGSIADIFFCPHRPEETCDCRKPKPGLILQACRRYGIDPAHTIMIGDSARDVLCGKAAGCGKTMLVRTGHFAAAQTALQAQNAPPDAVARDLAEAARLLLNDRRFV